MHHMAEIRLSAYPPPPPTNQYFSIKTSVAIFLSLLFFPQNNWTFYFFNLWVRLSKCISNIFHHFLFSVMLCCKTHFPPHLLSISNKTEQKETVQSSWTLDIWTNTCFIGKQTRNSLWSDFQFVLKCALQCNKWVAFLVSIINPPPPKKNPTDLSK